jgi:hypothetical protein
MGRPHEAVDDDFFRGRGLRLDGPLLGAVTVVAGRGNAWVARMTRAMTEFEKKIHGTIKLSNIGAVTK